MLKSSLAISICQAGAGNVQYCGLPSGEGFSLA